MTTEHGETASSAVKPQPVASEAPTPQESMSAAAVVAPPPATVQQLDPRVISVNRIAGAIVGVIFSGLHLIGAVSLFFAGDVPLWGRGLFALSWFPVTGLLLWLAVKWPVIEYRHWRYRVDAEGIEIWSGVIWRQQVVVPKSRVQHIDVSQGPVERSYGLATLSIHTAGTEYSKVDLPGLAHAVALTIRDALLPKDAEPAV